MITVVRSARFYFWVIIAANMTAMSAVVEASLSRALVYSIVISCLSTFGFLLNDLWDRKIDKINNSHHFENSNVRTVKIGTASMIVFLIAGLILAYYIGRSEFTLACVIALFLTAYTVFLRRVLFLPTIVTSILASSPLWIPLLLWEKNFDKWKFVFVVAIIIIISAREILMDTRDRYGDMFGCRDTFATVFTARIAKFVGVVLTISACIPFIMSVLFSAYSYPVVNILFAIAVTVIILHLLIYSAIRTLSDNQDEQETIQKYVLNSRLSMILIPILILLIWSK